jgi:hypothetical protein
LSSLVNYTHGHTCPLVAPRMILTGPARRPPPPPPPPPPPALPPSRRFHGRRQASTSELYGKIQEPRQSETTPFYPRSPYACAKLMAYWCVVNYREAYNMFAVNGCELPLYVSLYLPLSLPLSSLDSSVYSSVCCTRGHGEMRNRRAAQICMALKLARRDACWSGKSVVDGSNS